MIPKNIYYVWVGGNPKPDIFYQCLESWKANLPEYNIIEINESNFDFRYHLEHNMFFKTCYERKMWAFVSDYIRVVHLYENGGIYLDTDMQIIKNISCLIDDDLEFLAGFETESKINAAIMGVTKHSDILKSVIDFYNKDIWKSPLFTIPDILTFILNQNLCSTNELKHSYSDKKVRLYSPEYFYPYHFTESFSKKCITKNTFGIHWWDNSWSGINDNYLFLRTKHFKEPTKTFIKLAIKLKHKKIKL